MRCAVHWLPIDICRRQSSSSGPRLYTVRSEGGGSAQTCQNVFLDLLNLLQLVTTHADPFIKKPLLAVLFVHVILVCFHRLVNNQVL